jgi:hypothetical protein
MCANSIEFFNPKELDLEDGGQGTINHNIGVWDLSGRMCDTPHSLKTLTIFAIHKFDGLCGLVVPIIIFMLEVHVNCPSLPDIP